MGLPIPTVGLEPGPDWASDLNSALTLVDLHDHTPGYGVPVTPNGLNINADLTMASNNLLAARSIRFTAQGSPLALAADLGCTYVSGADLYYNDTAGNQVRITQSGAVAGTPGSISNLVAPASASYVSASSKFVWQSAALTPADMDGGAVILRNIVSNSKGLTLSPPAAMAANYTITLPTLPVASSFLVIDASGNMSATSATANGIVAANIAPLTITATQIANNTLTDTQLSTSARIIQIQTFNSSSTWTCPAGVTSALIFGRGGSGGGGGGIAAGGAGGSGGGGAMTGSKVVVVVPTTVYTVTIGAAGAGGAASSNGTAGGNSTFDTLATFKGAFGGLAGVQASPVAGGLGRLASGGTGGALDTSNNGASGAHSLYADGGAGGASTNGGGGGGAGDGAGGAGGSNSGTVGAAGTLGGGGGGGAGSSGSGNASGGAGIVGYITVVWVK